MLRRSVFGLAASTPCKGRPLTARLLLSAGMAWCTTSSASAGKGTLAHLWWGRLQWQGKASCVCSVRMNGMHISKSCSATGGALEEHSAIHSTILPFVLSNSDLRATPAPAALLLLPACPR
jgi:hypothetical protein